MSEAVELLREIRDLLSRLVDESASRSREAEEPRGTERSGVSEPAARRNRIKAQQLDLSPLTGVHRGVEDTPCQEKSSKLPKNRTRKVSKQPDPRHAPMVIALCDLFEKERGTKYLFHPRDAKALNYLLKIASDEEILARFKIGLNHEFPTCHSIYQLTANWNTYRPSPGEIVVERPMVSLDEIKRIREERDAKLKARFEKEQS